MSKHPKKNHSARQSNSHGKSGQSSERSSGQSSAPSSNHGSGRVEAHVSSRKPQARAVQSGLTNQKLAVILALGVVAFFGVYNFASGRNPLGGGAAIEGTATLEGNVQKISVATSSGSFNPNVLKVKAGVPVEIAFSQSPGGCLSGVLFPDFNINQDLTAGPQTVKLPALQPGTYTFYCQMQMLSAQIVAE